jgi:hypothetical protein
MQRKFWWRVSIAKAADLALYLIAMLEKLTIII